MSVLRQVQATAASERDAVGFPRPKDPPLLPERYAELRRRGNSGGIITPHRAFTTLPYRRTALAAIATIPIAISLIWLFLNSVIAEFWWRVLERGRVLLDLGGHTGMAVFVWTDHVQFGIPFIDIPIAASSPGQWLATALITAFMLLGAAVLRGRYTPLGYLLRAIAFLQFTALVYFAFIPARFPYRLLDYTLSGLAAGYGLIAGIPLLFGFIFFIFRISLWRKVALTVVAMVHLTILLPLQQLVHVWLMSRLSLIMMPALYFFFGLLLEVMLVIALYGWGMSWDGSVPGDAPA